MQKPSARACSTICGSAVHKDEEQVVIRCPNCGTTQGALTDAQGRFSFQAALPPGRYTLRMEVLPERRDLPAESLLSFTSSGTMRLRETPGNASGRNPLRGPNELHAKGMASSTAMRS